ncbi:transcription factor with AP2 domain(s) [Plasmodium berghei]|uniref:AP2 domain transcription factor AP2-G n=2 Tax=Plasmodium berghei TaxID=5821 RepID=A0A509AS67_PLABA|nr:AP2 domain transcription factor AP2-G [Plasmodium berghei ANKA]SCM26626.1 transcription factor with AP2 domain(s) [Plasmodium berghei]SCO62743.1 transcription factor with AP2 domain(s) [Plasmodium berghei]SCO64303.1 transcription factor with AP2 domain(s) [Plasmodium berghei]VUC58436.1 AP2 domain transcription factor AP2-G [Plasmodium berghei ANKA]|eukprot:XP_034424199.1 AP2 domain transcription factor AP2-G [Plasmodium berghei ANKA]
MISDIQNHSDDESKNNKPFLLFMINNNKEKLNIDMHNIKEKDKLNFNLNKTQENTSATNNNNNTNDKTIYESSVCNVKNVGHDIIPCIFMDEKENKVKNFKQDETYGMKYSKRINDDLQKSNLITMGDDKNSKFEKNDDYININNKISDHIKNNTNYSSNDSTSDSSHNNNMFYEDILSSPNSQMSVLNSNDSENCQLMDVNSTEIVQNLKNNIKINLKTFKKNNIYENSMNTGIQSDQLSINESTYKNCNIYNKDCTAINYIKNSSNYTDQNKNSQNSDEDKERGIHHKIDDNKKYTMSYVNRNKRNNIIIGDEKYINVDNRYNKIIEKQTDKMFIKNSVKINKSESNQTEIKNNDKDQGKCDVEIVDDIIKQHNNRFKNKKEIKSIKNKLVNKRKLTMEKIIKEIHKWEKVNYTYDRLKKWNISEKNRCINIYGNRVHIIRCLKNKYNNMNNYIIFNNSTHKMGNHAVLKQDNEKIENSIESKVGKFEQNHKQCNDNNKEKYIGEHKNTDVKSGIDNSSYIKKYITLKRIKERFLSCKTKCNNFDEGNKSRNIKNNKIHKKKGKAHKNKTNKNNLYTLFENKNDGYRNIVTTHKIGKEETKRDPQNTLIKNGHIGLVTNQLSNSSKKNEEPNNDKSINIIQENKKTQINVDEETKHNYSLNRTNCSNYDLKINNEHSGQNINNNNDNKNVLKCTISGYIGSKDKNILTNKAIDNQNELNMLQIKDDHSNNTKINQTDIMQDGHIKCKEGNIDEILYSSKNDFNTNLNILNENPKNVVIENSTQITSNQSKTNNKNSDQTSNHVNNENSKHIYQSNTNINIEDSLICANEINMKSLHNNNDQIEENRLSSNTNMLNYIISILGNGSHGFCDTFVNGNNYKKNSSYEITIGNNKSENDVSKNNECSDKVHTNLPLFGGINRYVTCPYNSQIVKTNQMMVQNEYPITTISKNMNNNMVILYNNKNNDNKSSNISMSLNSYCSHINKYHGHIMNYCNNNYYYSIFPNMLSNFYNNFYQFSPIITSNSDNYDYIANNDKNNIYSRKYNINDENNNINEINGLNIINSPNLLNIEINNDYKIGYINDENDNYFNPTYMNQFNAKLDHEKHLDSINKETNIDAIDDKSSKNEFENKRKIEDTNNDIIGNNDGTNNENGENDENNYKNNSLKENNNIEELDKNISIDHACNGNGSISIKNDLNNERIRNGIIEGNIKNVECHNGELIKLNKIYNNNGHEYEYINNRKSDEFYKNEGNNNCEIVSNDGKNEICSSSQNAKQKRHNILESNISNFIEGETYTENKNSANFMNNYDGILGDNNTNNNIIDDVNIRDIDKENDNSNNFNGSKNSSNVNNNIYENNNSENIISTHQNHGNLNGHSNFPFSYMNQETTNINNIKFENNDINLNTDLLDNSNNIAYDNNNNNIQKDSQHNMCYPLLNNVLHNYSDNNHYYNTQLLFGKYETNFENINKNYKINNGYINHYHQLENGDMMNVGLDNSSSNYCNNESNENSNNHSSTYCDGYCNGEYENCNNSGMVCILENNQNNNLSGSEDIQNVNINFNGLNMPFNNAYMENTQNNNNLNYFNNGNNCNIYELNSNFQNMSDDNNNINIDIYNNCNSGKIENCNNYDNSTTYIYTNTISAPVDTNNDNYENFLWNISKVCNNVGNLCYTFISNTNPFAQGMSNNLENSLEKMNNFGNVYTCLENMNNEENFKNTENGGHLENKKKSQNANNKSISTGIHNDDHINSSNEAFGSENGNSYNNNVKDNIMINNNPTSENTKNNITDIINENKHYGCSWNSFDYPIKAEIDETHLINIYNNLYENQQINMIDDSNIAKNIYSNDAIYAYLNTTNYLDALNNFNNSMKFCFINNKLNNINYENNNYENNYCVKDISDKSNNSNTEGITINNICDDQMDQNNNNSNNIPKQRVLNSSIGEHFNSSFEAYSSRLSKENYEVNCYQSSSYSGNNSNASHNYDVCVNGQRKAGKNTKTVNRTKMKKTNCKPGRVVNKTKINQNKKNLGKSNKIAPTNHSRFNMNCCKKEKNGTEGNENNCLNWNDCNKTGANCRMITTRNQIKNSNSSVININREEHDDENNSAINLINNKRGRRQKIMKRDNMDKRGKRCKKEKKKNIVKEGELKLTYKERRYNKKQEMKRKKYETQKSLLSNLDDNIKEMVDEIVKTSFLLPEKGLKGRYALDYNHPIHSVWKDSTRGHCSWRCRWWENGRRLSKNFNVKRFGNECALRLAVAMKLHKSTPKEQEHLLKQQREFLKLCYKNRWINNEEKCIDNNNDNNIKNGVETSPENTVNKNIDNKSNDAHTNSSDDETSDKCNKNSVLHDECSSE